MLVRRNAGVAKGRFGVNRQRRMVWRRSPAAEMLGVFLAMEAEARGRRRRRP